MKRAWIIGVLALGIPQIVFAQSGTICLFADSSGTVCSLDDSAPGLLQVFVIHTQTPGATAVQFSAPKPACMTGATWLGDSSPWPVTVGDSQNGISVGYGPCVSGPVHVLTISYAISGTTTADCAYPVLPDPSKSFVEVVNCNSEVRYGAGGTTFVNSAMACQCAGLQSPPVLEVAPSSMSFVNVEQLIETKTLHITNLGDQTLNWNVSENASWLSISQATGSDDAALTVTADRTGLATGQYNATISVTSNGGNATVSVVMTVTGVPGPVLSIVPANLDFGKLSTNQTFEVHNTGSGTLSWSINETIPWLSVSPTSGTNDAVVTVTVNRTGLAEGYYTTQVPITSNGGDTELGVSVTVGPVLQVIPTSLDFGEVDAVRTIQILNISTHDLNWSVIETISWLSVTPQSGTNDAVVTVTVNRTLQTPGTYSGFMSITSNGGDETVSVRMVVPTDPILSVVPTSLDLGETATSDAFEVRNVGGGTLHWSIGENVSWLDVTPLSGTNNAVITVTVDRTGLAPGSYDGQVSVSSDGGNATVTVQMLVPNPILSVAPTMLDFGNVSMLETFTITNIGTGTLTWDITEAIPWLDVSPTSGTNGQTINVTVDRTGLPDGTYNDVIDVTSNGGNASVSVAMQVGGPILDVAPTSLNFGDIDSVDTFQILNVGNQDLNWSVSESAPWMEVTPPNGTNDAVVTVSVDRTGLVNGNYQATISVTSNGGSAAVVVDMVVANPILDAIPSSISFSASSNQRPLRITNIGTGTLIWSVASDQPWLTTTPTAGSSPPDVILSVQVDRTGLSPGTYNGNLTITSNGGTVIVPITMAAAPVLSVDPTLIALSPTMTQATFDISNTSVGTLTWTISKNASWIQLSPPLSGSGDHTTTVTVDPDSVPPGDIVTGNVFVNSNGGAETVLVRFTRVGTGPGTIGLFADPAGTSANIEDHTVGLLAVYVVHVNTAGATASQFSAPLPSCWTGAVYLSDSSIWPVLLGNSQTGIALGYGTCLASPIHILTINYFVQGISGCCFYPVLPDPRIPSGEIEVVDCAGQLLFGGGGSATINCTTVKVEETTWGRVKAIYAPQPEDSKKE